jgi:hypothetical protein
MPLEREFDEEHGYKGEDKYEARVLENLSQEKVDKAVNFIRGRLPDKTKREIEHAIKKDPGRWVAQYHFNWGMAMRNELRSAGFGEDFFDVENLDYIYVMLIEKAVKKEG